MLDRLSSLQLFSVFLLFEVNFHQSDSLYQVANFISSLVETTREVHLASMLVIEHMVVGGAMMIQGEDGAEGTRLLAEKPEKGLGIRG